MFYQEYLPGISLRETIACYWKFVIPSTNEAPFEHTAPPDGCVSLMFCYLPNISATQIFLIPPSLSVLRSTITPGSVYIGIRFLPGAFPCFFNTPIESLQSQELKNIIRQHFNDLLPNIREDFSDFTSIDNKLTALNPKIPDREVQKVVQAVNLQKGQCKVSDLVKHAYIGERQLQRRFRKQVGLSMKELARVRRIREAIIQMVLQQKNQTELSYDSGYYDQAHFLHEFQAFADMPPSQLEQYLRGIKHGELHW